MGKHYSNKQKKLIDLIDLIPFDSIDDFIELLKSHKELLIREHQVEALKYRKEQDSKRFINNNGLKMFKK